MGAVLGTFILGIFRKLIYPKVRFQLSSYALLWFLFFKAAGLFALICLFAGISTLFLSFDQMVFLTSDRWFYLFFPVNLKSGEGTQRITNKRQNGIGIHRSFSTILKDKTTSLNPNWISGFADAPSKALVIWGTNLDSTVGVKFSITQLAMVQLAPYQYSVIIGLLLSDGWLIFASKTHKNARLGFAQFGAQGEYVFFVFNILSHYCSSSPRVTTGIRAGNRLYALQFFTRSMPCFTKLYYLFYPNGVKIIPEDIYNMLTPVALAHIIMGDGTAREYGLEICTNSYSLEDVVRLMNVLMIRYRLKCSLRLKKRQNNKIEYMIYISQSSMPSLLNIVSPYMHSSMLYKLKSSLSNPSNRQKIEVFDLQENTTTYYNSMSETARALNINHARIVMYFSRNQNKPYKDRYVFKKVEA